MPTGPAHRRKTEVWFDANDNECHSTVPCRCTVGHDHDDDHLTLVLRADDEDDEDDEYLSPAEAELIWLHSGMDEDYDFRR